MKMIWTTGLAALMATALFAQSETPKVQTAKAEAPKAADAKTEKPKTINVVSLEDDSFKATVVAPAELGAKPETIAIPAEAIVEKAVEAKKTEAQKAEQAAISADALEKQAEAAGVEARPNTANIKSLTLPGTVIPPSSDMAKTLEDAVRNILIQAGKQIGTVSTNGVENLTMPYQQLGDGKSYEVEWRKALRLLLTPVGYNFTEDGELVLFGLAAEVDVKHKQLAQERLTSNRTPILFITNESEGGMDLRTAIRDVSVKADVTITTDYMEQGDLYAPVQTAAEGQIKAEDIAKAKEKTAVQQSQVKRTTFDTNGQQVEWRIVLREILNPHDYDFVEVGGVVRIAKRAKLKQWEQEEVAKKPLTARVIRLYHADPEAVVERVTKIKDLLKHPNASLQATRKKDDNTDVVKSTNSRLQTSEGKRSGMSDTTSQVFDKLIRPRTVPAIIAYDVEENMDAIEERIRLFDIKEKQILIEAIIFQLTTDNDAEGDGNIDGVKWEGFEKFVPLYGSVGNAAAAAKYADLLARDGFKLRDGKQVWMRTDGFDFQTMIQLIRKRDNSKLLASPMLVVGDHSEAAIQVSDVMPVLEIQQNNTYNGDTTQRDYTYQWNMIRSGIMMWVSPEITESGSSVRLTVHPQVVDRSPTPVVKLVPGIGEVENYELMMHEMDTRATVPTGATLMFGGLIDNEESEVEDKVRWLGDIPWIGWFFRSKTTKITQKNLIIMVRPTILEDTDETGFETNAIKESESVMINSGRDLKKTPLEGPYSVKEVKENIRELYEERVVNPLKDEEETDD